jgi:transcription elongation factor Elf1
MKESEWTETKCPECGGKAKQRSRPTTLAKIITIHCDSCGKDWTFSGPVSIGDMLAAEIQADFEKQDRDGKGNT